MPHGRKIRTQEETAVKETDNIARISVCPRCGQTYHGRPAVSRADGRTPLCPDCGTREALESIGVGAEEQERIIDTIHRHQA